MKWEGEMTGEVMDYLWSSLGMVGFKFVGKRKELEVYFPDGVKVYRVGQELVR